MTTLNLTRNKIIAYFKAKHNPNLSINSNSLEFELMNIFCVFDELLHHIGYKDHHHTRFYLVDALTVIYLSCQEAHINYKKALKLYQTILYDDYYSQFYHNNNLDKTIISLSRFSYILSDKRTVILKTFTLFSDIMNSIIKSTDLIIDSFPIEMGKIYRESQLKLANSYGVNLKGYNASKKSFFLGFKITLLIDSLGTIAYFCIDKACVHDLTVAREFLPQIQEFVQNKTIYTDKGYLFKEDELQSYANNHTKFITPKKIYKSMTEGEKLTVKKGNLALSKTRKYIETINALIVSKIGRKIHATNLDGFIFKLQMLVFNFQLNRSFNTKSDVRKNCKKILVAVGNLYF